MSETLTAIEKMAKDIKNASIILNKNEARFLVDSYYQMQESRIRADAQVRSMADEPNDVLAWLAKQNSALENQIKSALDKYSLANPVGKWARSICGVGPVIAAGLLANIDITKAPTAGHIWRFAGLDPTSKWESRAQIKTIINDIKQKNENITKAELLNELCFELGRNPDLMIERLGEEYTETSISAEFSKRPFNASLKVLCWKLGESFVKVSGNEKDYYGKIYSSRKQQETAYNAMGKFKEQAEKKLANCKIGKDTEAYKEYSQGRLPKAHIHQRAKRYAVKMFLAHLHEIWFIHEFGVEPPLPYPIKFLGHTHKINPPIFGDDE